MPARTSRVARMLFMRAARPPRAGWPAGHTRPRQHGHEGVVRRKRRRETRTWVCGLRGKGRIVV